MSFARRCGSLIEPGALPLGRRACRILIVLSLAVVWTGAAAGEPKESGRHFWPSKTRWKGATLGALRDPETWGPAAGAGVVAAAGWDRQISRWAVEHTPVFGSPDGALRAGDRLRAASDLGMLATALAIPDPEAPWESRFERILVEEAGAVLTTSTTSVLKRATGRERPDASDDESFPSAHASRAFAYAAMSTRNLDAIELPRAARIGLKACLIGLAGGTGWARVEAGVHFPTDVLVGEALGNFVGRLIHDAFLGGNERCSVTMGFDGRSPVLVVRLRIP